MVKVIFFQYIYWCEELFVFVVVGESEEVRVGEDYETRFHSECPNFMAQLRWKTGEAVECV